MKETNRDFIRSKDGDYVKVVYCRDCKYSVEHAPFYLCFKAIGGVVKKADGFCDCGERKERGKTRRVD